MTFFQSPQLPVHEIVASLNEYNIDVSEVDFRRPDPRRWREVYSVIYEALSGRSIEAAIQTNLGNMKMNTANPELCEEAVSQMAFTQCLQRVLSGCGYNNFSLKDVIQPSSKAVQRIASVFLNRTRHDMRLLDFIEETRERAQKSFGEYESVLKKNKEYAQRLSADEENQVHRKAEMQKVEDEVEDQQKALEELKAVSTEEKRSGQDLKLKISELDSNKAALKQAIELKSQECEQLSRKIVQSPKKFQIEQDRLQNKVMDMKSQGGKEEQAVSEMRLLLEQTLNKIDAATKAEKLVLEVQADFDKDVELCNEISALREKKSDLEEAANSCNPQAEDLAERFHVRRAQKHSLTSLKDVWQQSNLPRLADLKSYLDKLKENMKTATSETTVIQDTLSQLRHKLSEVEAWSQTERLDLQNEEERLVQIVNMLDEINEQGLANVRMCRPGS